MHPVTRHLAARPRRAFTLLELIVTIVILGILAALAVPAFNAVIDRSRDSQATTTWSAVIREAQAIAAFEDRGVTADDIAEALGDLTAADGVVDAAGAPYTYVDTDADDDGTADGVVGADQWSVNDPGTPTVLLASDAEQAAEGRIVAVAIPDPGVNPIAEVRDYDDAGGTPDAADTQRHYDEGPGAGGEAGAGGGSTPPTGYAAMSWGSDSWARLGDGTGNTNQPVPVDVTMPSGVTFTQVSAGNTHSLALDTDGNAWAWGYAADGRLGVNDAVAVQHVPVAVVMPAGVTFTQVSAGNAHSLAIDADGNAWAWGDDTHGQLGNGAAETADQLVPVPVTMPAGVTFTDISAGYVHSVALGSDGAAWSWGSGSSGRLGEGSTSGILPAPVSATMPGGVNFTAVDAGLGHSLALDGSGNAWAWGLNNNGQLGEGTSSDQAVPTMATMPGGVTFTAISGGRFHSLALAGDGTAWSWGANDVGQLGDGSTSPRAVPTAVDMPSGVTFAAVEAGWYAGAALDGAGAAWTWGSDSSGLLGDDVTLVDQISPVQVALPAGSTAHAVNAGVGHMVALVSGP